ncbi:MAG: hypothetical protein AABX91_02080 [Nanoarchaeota archaeon]
MEFNIYHIVYDIGDIDHMEAVVSSTSPEQARQNLRNYLGKEFLDSGLSLQFLDEIVKVRLITYTNVKADKEQILCPRISSGLEMKMASLATETVPKS